MQPFSSKHIAYVERASLDQMAVPLRLDPATLRAPAAGTVALARVHAVAAFWADDPSKLAAHRMMMADIAAGAHGQRMPLIQVLHGFGSQLHYHLGTCRFDASSPDPTGLRQMLRSSYPGLDVRPLSGSEATSLQRELAAMGHGGLVVGTPTVKLGSDLVGTEQVERLVRGLRSAEWALVVVAAPREDAAAAAHRAQVRNELRIVENAARGADGGGPTARAYSTALEALCERADMGARVGMWQVTTYYLAATREVALRAAALIRAVYSGSDSHPDPVRPIPCEGAGTAAGSLAQVLAPGRQGPGKLSYPYAYAQLLSSRDLVALLQLPTEESPGYFVRNYARFDVAHRASAVKRPLQVGAIQDRGQPIGDDYVIDLDDVRRHVLVAGTTGSGKTNTVFHLLDQVVAHGASYLVIEPAKAEYRQMLARHAQSGPRVFTAGSEHGSPLRLNPLEVYPGVHVQTHIDRLKALFDAAFVLYAPMPHVLERCLHAVYVHKGWNLLTGRNDRGLHPDAQPTLSDLYDEIAPMTETLGYERRLTMDITAALQTRINSLRIGAKGTMLDTRLSVPIASMLEAPAIVELEWIGDEEEKAFVMGLLLMALYEHRVTVGPVPAGALPHVTVVEEAHRLLRAVPSTTDTETANARGKAVETFCNMLSEIRAYGEGFVVAEQIPSKLAPDLVKNTNLKILHRVVGVDDRLLVGGAMNAEERQLRSVGALETGEAMVFGTRDDAPLLVRVPRAAGLDGERVIGDADVRRSTESLRAGHWQRLSLLSRCAQQPRRVDADAARTAADAPDVRSSADRYVLSVAVHAEALVVEFGYVRRAISTVVPEYRQDRAFINQAVAAALAGALQRLGRARGWRYDQVENATRLLLAALAAVSRARRDGRTRALSESERELVSRYQDLLGTLLVRRADPFASCADACGKTSCRYRSFARARAADPQLARRFTDLSKAGGRALRDALLRATEGFLTERAPSPERASAACCLAMHLKKPPPGHTRAQLQPLLTAVRGQARSDDG